MMIRSPNDKQRWIFETPLGTYELNAHQRARLFDACGAVIAVAIANAHRPGRDPFHAEPSAEFVASIPTTLDTSRARVGERNNKGD